jgi:hypothetical protein
MREIVHAQCSAVHSKHARRMQHARTRTARTQLSTHLTATAAVAGARRRTSMTLRCAITNCKHVRTRTYTHAHAHTHPFMPATSHGNASKCVCSMRLVCARTMPPCSARTVRTVAACGMRALALCSACTVSPCNTARLCRVRTVPRTVLVRAVPCDAAALSVGGESARSASVCTHQSRVCTHMHICTQSHAHAPPSHRHRLPAGRRCGSAHWRRRRTHDPVPGRQR